MIKRLDITGVHMVVGDNLKKYVTKKIGRLDRFMPSDTRDDVQVYIRLKEGDTKASYAERTCEVVAHLPGETITIKETTINIFAAVDIAVAKFSAQLKKYKALRANPRLHQRVLARLKHRPV